MKWKKDRTQFKNQYPIGNILFLAGTCLFALLAVWVNLFHFQYKMNSDIASEAILGKVIWESGQLIPDSWYPSTETRIITTPNLAALFFGITGDMTIAQGLACSFMMILILAGACFFFSLAGEKWKQSGGIMSFLIMVLPANYVILELLYLFAGYYAIHVPVFFLTAGIYMRLLKADSDFQWGKSAVCLVLALLLGLQGIRGILVTYGPLLVIELMRRGYDRYRNRKSSRKDWLISLWVSGLFTVSYIGTCFPLSAGQDISRNIRNGFPKLLQVVWPDFLRALGLKDSLFSMGGKLCILIFAAVAFYLAGGILLSMFRKKEVDPAEWVFLMVCGSPVAAAFAAAFTTIESSQRYYFMVPFALAFGRWKRKGKLFLGICCVILAADCMAGVYLPILRSEEPPRSESYEVVRFLEEKGYERAYSDFENANSMTVLSEGRVWVAPVASVGKMDICKWLSSKEWYPPYTPYEQKTAYIVTEAKREEFESFRIEHQEQLTEIKKIGHYIIFGSDYNLSNLGEN